MARHSLSEPEIRELADRAALLVLREGSVNKAQQALVASLPEDRTEGWVHTNRLHTLLSDDARKSLNSDTVGSITWGLEHLEEPLDVASAKAASEDLREHVVERWGTLVAAKTAASPGALMAEVARDEGIPAAVARWVLTDAGSIDGGTPSAAPPSPTAERVSPDWSFQDLAYRRCTDRLLEDPNRKVGLVLPTGGGKTRVATRIMLKVLAASPNEEDVVLWITHRHRLKTQATRELQRAIREGTPDLPEEAMRILGDRVKMCMTHELPEKLEEFAGRTALVVVDEAHHAAAPSYEPIFDRKPLRGLFLTATPNRTDLMPIGIDEVAYTTTYRELFDRGVIIRPTIEELPLFGFDWDSPERVNDLADYILSRAEAEFKKTLVSVVRVEDVELLHAALLERLGQYPGHPLAEEDIGFVHGSASSTDEPPQAFLDEFQAKPLGVVVATQGLLGEGFDDPAVDAVVVTYPTGSLVDLMQVAGRCMRYAPGKDAAYVVQLRTSALAYHWEQRWLYQDISDVLRPRLDDVPYADYTGLVEAIEKLLGDSNVSEAVAASSRSELAELSPGDECSLLLTGLPYDGDVDDFKKDARWNALLVTPAERERFRRIFNDFSDREAEVPDTTTFLQNYLEVDPRVGSLWRRYKDMLDAMRFASKELPPETEYAGRSSRPSTERGTTWLTYISFVHEPALPAELQAFLAGAVNREEIATQYMSSRPDWRGATKIVLPLGGTLAFLLDDLQWEWLQTEREQLRTRLSGVNQREAFEVIANWRAQLQSAPVAQVLVERVETMVSEANGLQLTLELAA